MNLPRVRQIVDYLGGGIWSTRLADLKAQVQAHPLAKEDREWLRSQLNAAQKKRQRGRLLNLTLLALVSDQDRWSDWLRKSPIIRASRYDYDPLIPQFLCGELLAAADGLGLQEKFRQFLRSSLTLLDFTGEVQLLQRSIVARLFEDKKKVLKSLLALIDLMFLLRQEFQDTQFYGLTPEEAASGVSYLVFLYSQRIDLRNASLGPLDDQRVSSDFYPRLLVDSVKLVEYSEVEFLLAHFDYSCEPDGTGGVTVQAPTRELARSLRLGYFQTSMQTFAFNSHPDENAEGALSLRDMGVGLLKAMQKEGLLQLLEKPIRRWRFAFPGVQSLVEFVSSDALFREEYDNVLWLSKELVSTPNELLSFEIDGLPLSSLVKAQRAVNVFRFAMSSFFGTKMKTEPGLVAQSIVPVFTDKRLQDLFTLGTGSADVAAKVVRMLTWNPNDETPFDLMYQPLLRAEDGKYMVPMGVLGSADIIRNSLQLKRQRLSDGKNDLLGMLVRDLFRAIPWPAECDVKYSFAGEKGDIDAATLADGTLFVFECKNSLHPCSTAELRTSYDHIRHAQEQLDKLLRVWALPGFKQYLEGKLGWQLAGVRRVVTGVITANRMFSGMRVGQHAIRPFYETGNFIKSGSINIFGTDVRLRPEGPLTAEALTDFVVSDVLHGKNLASMQQEDRRITFEHGAIRIEDYRQNPALLAESFGVPVPMELREQLGMNG